MIKYTKHKDSTNNIIAFVVSALLMLPSFYSCSCQGQLEINDATVNYSYDSKGLMHISMAEGKSFIIDTGADGSIIFEDRIHIKSTISGTTLVNNQKKTFIHTIESLQIGNLLIKNCNFVFMKTDNTVWQNDTSIVGIIGMDILSQKHTYFDIKNQTITFSDNKKVKPEPPTLILPYKSTKSPAFDLIVNGIVFDNILFDTGFDLFLKLPVAEMDTFNNYTSLRTSFSSDILDSQLFDYHKSFDIIVINGIIFSDQEISFSQNYRLIGMMFIKCWSGFSIDPFKKEITFYL